MTSSHGDDPVSTSGHVKYSTVDDKAEPELTGNNVESGIEESQTAAENKNSKAGKSLSEDRITNSQEELGLKDGSRDNADDK